MAKCCVGLAGPTAGSGGMLGVHEPGPRAAGHGRRSQGSHKWGVCIVHCCTLLLAMAPLGLELGALHRCGGHLRAKKLAPAAGPSHGFVRVCMGRMDLRGFVWICVDLCGLAHCAP